MTQVEGKRPPYVGIDIGGTNTRIGLLPTLNVPEFTLIARFPTEQDYEQQVRRITVALQGSASVRPVGIGVSIAGKIAKDGSSVIVAPNLPGYLNQPFVAELASRFGCPVRLAHDTVCGLLGEKKFGAIQHDDRCAYLTVSTGTGGAIQLRKGSTVLTISIEIGHQLLDGNERACLCGQIGCLETCTGGRQLELRLGHTLSHVNDTTFWGTFSDKLALGLVNLAQLTKVEVVSVSGAIALNNPLLIPLLQEKVSAMIRGTTLELRPAVLQENAPLIGAALLLETSEETILH